MCPRAVRPTLQQRGTFTRSRSANCHFSRLRNSKHIISIKFHTLHPITGRPSANLGNPTGVREWDFCRELIVLTDKQHRQFPDAGHVQTFMEGTIIHGTITKKGHRHRSVSKDLRAVSPAAGLQNTRPDNATGPHHTDLRGEQMHGPATPPRTPGHTTEQFGHQVLWCQPLGQSMPVPTMRAEDTVCGFQMSTDCRGNRLLTYVRVTGAMHQTSLMTARQLLLGLTDDLHGPIQFEHRVRRHEREFPEW